MSSDLTGKVAFVTGAAMGIGRGVSETLARRGARVAMFDIDPGLNSSAADLQADGCDVAAWSGTVVELRSVGDALAETSSHFGGIDILVNCAGVVRYGDAVDLELDDWDLQINTNLRSVFILAKLGVPHLRARGGGVIVSLASVQAFATQRGVPAYTASKGGVVALTRSLAVDYASEGIRAVAIAPGSVDTPMLRKSAELSADAEHSVDDVLLDWDRSHPLGRVATVDDVAKLAAFLVSDDASMITGVTVTIDGGLTSQVGVVR